MKARPRPRGHAARLVHTFAARARRADDTTELLHLTLLTGGDGDDKEPR